MVKISFTFIRFWRNTRNSHWFEMSSNAIHIFFMYHFHSIFSHKITKVFDEISNLWRVNVFNQNLNKVNQINPNDNTRDLMDKEYRTECRPTSLVTNGQLNHFLVKELQMSNTSDGFRPLLEHCPWEHTSCCQ